MYVTNRLSGIQAPPGLGRFVPEAELQVKQGGASTEAVTAATWPMTQIFRGLSSLNADLLRGLAIHLHIIPHDKPLTDVAEFRRLRGKTTSDGKPYETLRGTGGMRLGSRIVYAVGEETLVPIAGVVPYYEKGFVLAYESGHLVCRFALLKAQQDWLQRLFDERKKTDGPWVSPDARSNPEAYFSSSTAAMFGRPRRNMAPDLAQFTRAWLYHNDRLMHLLQSEVFTHAPGPIPD